jgi:YidC/Oxa1 family membrane protein insertase
VDRRGLLAIVLCVAIFLFWFQVIAPKLWPQPPKKPVPPRPDAAQAAPHPPPPVPPAPPPPSPEVPRKEYKAEPALTLETRRFKVVFTNVGAGIDRLVLRYPDEQGEVLLLGPQAPAPPHLAVRHVGGSETVESLPWEIAERKEDLVEFRRMLPNGVEISKTFQLDPQRHTLRMVLFLHNRAPAAPDGKPPAEQPVRLEILAFNGLLHDSSYRYDQFSQGIVCAGKRFVAWPFPKVEKAEKSKEEERRKEVSYGEEDRKWAGLKNRFFAVLFAPGSDREGRLVQRYEFRSVGSGGDLKTLAVTAATGDLSVGAQPVGLEFTVFAGPVQSAALKEGPAGAAGLIDYGGSCFIFAPLVNLVAPIILGLLKTFASLLGNYGVAIIFTTIVIRICLFPLSYKSQLSAYRMQQLAPKVQALKERYGDDRQKFGMEQMRLFREHKINPLSGCLPLILQLPIFIGMYTVFEISIELRRAPFLLWIGDLSRPDQILGPWKTVNIPLIITTLSIEALNLLPIVMTITWFLQAYFAPRSPDPQMQMQQKMLLFMPVVFGLMCYGLASGLSLYFLVNSLLGMTEQKLIKKFFLKPVGSPSSP